MRYCNTILKYILSIFQIISKYFHEFLYIFQDYSANIENFYPSENEMTDDDIDLEITDSNYESESNQIENNLEHENINNNNGNDDLDERIQLTILPSQNNLHKQIEMVKNATQNEIPDLLKTISANNNNNDTKDYDLHCSDTDIENNFHTKDIIGDFNKEIEDEIKLLLNYNINIQDDLEGLRKDIQDTFAKPIENTINNISDVVNHVIKKLVKTHMDTCEQNENLLPEEEEFKLERQSEEVINDVNVENETNTRTEMKLSRPTFLLIENNADSNIIDAFLSDAKEEINVYENEYDTEALTNNVEKTIQQLSTELRKIIPKLDEMRERDRLWSESRIEVPAIVTDRNLNEIASSSKCYSVTSATSVEHKIEVSRKPIFSQIQPVNRKVAIATRM